MTPEANIQRDVLSAAAKFNIELKFTFRRDKLYIDCECKVSFGVFVLYSCSHVESGSYNKFARGTPKTLTPMAYELCQIWYPTLATLLVSLSKLYLLELLFELFDFNYTILASS